MSVDRRPITNLSQSGCFALSYAPTSALPIYRRLPPAVELSRDMCEIEKRPWAFPRTRSGEVPQQQSPTDKLASGHWFPYDDGSIVVWLYAGKDEFTLDLRRQGKDLVGELTLRHGETHVPAHQKVRLEPIACRVSAPN